MPEIRLYPLNERLTVSKGTPLIDVLHEYGVEFPCGGRGTCGGCKINVLEGDIPLTPAHRKRLNEHGLSEEWRLACLSHVESDVTLLVDQWRHLILADQTVFPFVSRSGHGIAVDVGTTTLAAQLIDLRTAEVQAVATGVNPQSRFGADIMSRVEYEVTKNSGQQTVLIRKKVYELIRDLLGNCDYDVKKIILVGNTVMHHLFCGFDLSPLSMYPFESPDLAAVSFSALDLHWNLDCEPEITFMPCIGGFVGSDILAGLLASRLHETDDINCLIDLGTNGEIAVGNRDDIICASTAAGPAFEGINISCGMGAAAGALSSLKSTGSALDYHIIGDSKPVRGICGSGLLDAVAWLLDSGQLDAWGQLKNNAETVELIPGLSLTQKDIRQVQLAKGAVAAGLEILASQRCESIDQISEYFIAGAFGSYLDLDSARRI